MNIYIDGLWLSSAGSEIAELAASMYSAATVTSADTRYWGPTVGSVASDGANF